jgi:hypothetical protein
MDRLPPELLLHIFDQLTTEEIIYSCHRVCKRWRQLNLPTIYKNCDVASVTQLSQLHKTLSLDPQLSQYIRQLSIQIPYTESSLTLPLITAVLQGQQQQGQQKSDLTMRRAASGLGSLWLDFKAPFQRRDDFSSKLLLMLMEHHPPCLTYLRIGNSGQDRPVFTDDDMKMLVRYHTPDPLNALNHDLNSGSVLIMQLRSLELVSVSQLTDDGISYLAYPSHRADKIMTEMTSVSPEQRKIIMADYLQFQDLKQLQGRPRDDFVVPAEVETFICSHFSFTIPLEEIRIVECPHITEFALLMLVFGPGLLRLSRLELKMCYNVVVSSELAQEWVRLRKSRTWLKDAVHDPIELDFA